MKLYDLLVEFYRFYHVDDESDNVYRKIKAFSAEEIIEGLDRLYRSEEPLNAGGWQFGWIFGCLPFETKLLLLEKSLTIPVTSRTCLQQRVVQEKRIFELLRCEDQEENTNFVLKFFDYGWSYYSEVCGRHQFNEHGMEYLLRLVRLLKDCLVEKAKGEN